MGFPRQEYWSGVRREALGMLLGSTPSPAHSRKGHFADLPRICKFTASCNSQKPNPLNGVQDPVQPLPTSSLIMCPVSVSSASQCWRTIQWIFQYLSIIRLCTLHPLFLLPSISSWSYLPSKGLFLFLASKSTIFKKVSVLSCHPSRRS